MSVTEDLSGDTALFAHAALAGRAVTAGFALVIVSLTIVARAVSFCAAIQIARTRGDALSVTEDLSGDTALFAHTAPAGCAIATGLALVIVGILIVAHAIPFGATIGIVLARGDALSIAEDLTGNTALFAFALFAGCAVAASFALVIVGILVIAYAAAFCTAVQIARSRRDALSVAQYLSLHAALHTFI